ncbi:uncharacterized protein LOC129299795 [Prosopis cineraria]|uniref:uncharacterized protein LOC129299795 n=1 Tax=Prosopis cineraria TaxID=364024 RepID=UPI00240FE6B8|nr:uncharacterized protein LOC129299795 [Prosopis cineraria]
MEGNEKFLDYRVGTLPTVLYIPNFITDNEENFLLNNIYAAPPSKWKSLKNRRLQNWGMIEFSNLLKVGVDFVLSFLFMSICFSDLCLLAVPPWLTNLTQKICERSGLFPSAINHVLINEYLSNQGIMVCA